MTEEQVLAEFRAAEALLEGHFILSSGLHSPRYLQWARVLTDPARASRLASALAAIEAAGGEVIAAAALVDRSNGEADLAAMPAEKPGSRKAA